MHELKESNNNIISQLCAFLKQFDDSNYSKKLSVLNGSTIGMHVRHILEFYSCFLENIDSNGICYDSRKRKLIYEVSVSSTISEFKIISDRILKLENNSSIELKSNASLKDGREFSIKSSIARELLYTLDHSIHHMAIIKIGTQTCFPEFIIPETFGVAPSTIRFKKEKCAQ